MAQFDSKACFDSQFKTNVTHKSGPFGLLNTEISIEKDKCNITVNYKKILSRKWSIDICREPIHLKVDNDGALEFAKKIKACRKGSSDDFCDEEKKLFTKIEEDGLIFAAGQRDSLESDHGKVYCVSLVLKKYLKHNQVFSPTKTIELFSAHKVLKSKKIEIEIEKSKPVESIEIEKEDSSKPSIQF